MSLLGLACNDEPASNAPAPVQETQTASSSSESTEQVSQETQEDAEPPLLDPGNLESLKEGIVLLLTQTDPMGGTRTQLVVNSGGETVLSTEEIGGNKPIGDEKKFQIQAHQLLSLADGLKGAHTCGLKSTATEALPDDGGTTIRLRLEGLTCDVLLWNSETSSKAAKTSLNMIQALIPR
jgi:hypothetical protein